MIDFVNTEVAFVAAVVGAILILAIFAAAWPID